MPASAFSTCEHIGCFVRGRRGGGERGGGERGGGERGGEERRECYVLWSVDHVTVTFSRAGCDGFVMSLVYILNKPEWVILSHLLSYAKYNCMKVKMIPL